MRVYTKGHPRAPMLRMWRNYLMHWFWRAAIAVVVASAAFCILYALCVAIFLYVSPGSPGVWFIVVRLCIVLGLPIISIAVYGLLTHRFGPANVECRRRRKGLCLKCGYNLTGNVSGVCPECGTKFQSSTMKIIRRNEQEPKERT